MNVDAHSSPVMLSIIVPVYNVEAYLSKCLGSLAKQVGFNIEIIIVDDGSTDSSLQVCQLFALKVSNVRVYAKANEGQGVARNYGIDLARGKYLIFVDSDDSIESTLVSDLLPIIEREEADFLNYGLDFITATNTSLKTIKTFGAKYYFGAEIFQRALLDNDILSIPWNKIYRRSLLIENDIRFPAIRVNEDIYFSRTVAFFSKKTVFVEKVYYHALVRAGSTSRKMHVGIFRATQELFEFERNTFQLVDSKLISVFSAHVVKLLSYLLIQAAFRIEKDAEYFSCFEIASNCGFESYSGDWRVVANLRLKNRFLLLICRYPRLLRILCKVCRFFGFTPY